MSSNLCDECKKPLGKNGFTMIWSWSDWRLVSLHRDCGPEILAEAVEDGTVTWAPGFGGS